MSWRQNYYKRQFKQNELEHELRGEDEDQNSRMSKEELRKKLLQEQEDELYRRMHLDDD